MSQRLAHAGCALLCALSVAWGLLYVHRTSFLFEGERVFCLWDDAMISMQYARNLSRGDGLVWNAGEEPIQGFTNPGVTLVMAAIHFLPLGAAKMALCVQLFCLALLAACQVLTWRIGRSLFPDEPMVALGSLVGVALCAPFNSLV